MDYLFRQHYSYDPDMPVVLLFERDAEASAMYARHLSSMDVSVCVCTELIAVPEHVTELRPHVLVLNPAPDLNLSLKIVERAMDIHPTLSVITLGGIIPDLYLDRLMSTGVSMHINRNLSQPRDLVLAVRQMLH